MFMFSSRNVIRYSRLSSECSLNLEFDLSQYLSVIVLVIISKKKGTWAQVIPPQIDLLGLPRDILEKFRLDHLGCGVSAYFTQLSGIDRTDTLLV